MNTPHHTVLITGATSGFGEATARKFAASGACQRIIITGRRADRLEKLKAELTALHPHCPVTALQFDVRDRGAVQKALATLTPPDDAITILVNNAGLALGLEPAHEASTADWDAMIDTNCKGLAYCTRAILPGMVKRGCGHIINIGSIAGTYPYPGGNVYGGTKAFVKQFSLNLRAELVAAGAAGVRVSCIEPGMAETEFSLVRFHGDAAKASKVYDGMKPLSGDDIAEAVFWAAMLPSHVNINSIELMPTAQASGPLAVKRNR